MKLIKCHIENFGKLSGVDYDFNSGFTQFCQNNGYGKTTLAAFIKAMFYGLPPVRVNAREFNDRKHFYPFSNGKFGGNLSFETGGDIYRIERFFGKKSDLDDELTVYCNNKIFDGFNGNVGKAVFGVDKESFERTVFINSDAVETSATGSMLSRLTGFVENSDEISLDNVIANIEKAKKSLKAAKGNNDLISATNAEIFELNSEIANLESISKTLDENYNRKNGLEKRILQAEDEIEKIKNANLVLERWEKYDAMSSHCKETEKALKVWQEKFPGGLPDEDENLKIKQYVRQITQLNGAQTSAVFDDEKKERLKALSQIFSGGVPSEEQMHDISRELDEIKGLIVKINGLSEKSENQRFADLQQKFKDKVPDGERLESFDKKIERYRELDNRRKAQANVVAPASAPAKKNGVIYIVLLAIALAVAVAGVALIFVNIAVGASLLAAGVAAAVLDLVFWKIKPSAAGQSTVVIDQTAIDNQAEMQQLESAVREFLVAYGYYSQNGIVFDFEMLKNDLKEYARQIEEEQKRDEKISELQQNRDGLIAKVKEVFIKYDAVSETLQGAFIKLSNMIAEYKNLQADSVKAEKNAEDTKGRIEALYGAIEKIFEKYDIIISGNLFLQVEEIAGGSLETERLKNELKKSREEMADYVNRYGLSQRPTSETVDITELTAKVKEARNQLAILDGQISSDEALIENLGDKYSRKEALEEKLKEYRRRYYILSETEKAVKRADQNLKDRFVSPVKDIFLRYVDVIENTIGEKITLDSEFNVMFENCGEMHSERHFSSGLRSICALCMRLAFVENMYAGEKPFIIMDDPFVYLDNTHMENTAKVIKELSKDIQIIYLCCHDSRKITA